MPARPSDHIDWNTNAVAAERMPNGTEQTDGHASGSLLTRQLWNGIMNRIGLWIRWFLQSVFRSDDIFADQQSRAHSNTPSTGAGLGPVAAGDFAARVFINGHAVGPVDSPAHTYTASRDTYWDLDEDGTWTAAEVVNGNPAPAVTANSVRCFMVATDGSDRTAVTDLTPAYVTVDQPLNLQGVLYHQEVGTPTYQLVDQDLDSSGTTLPTRVYRSDTGPTSYGGHCRCVAVNALWNEGAGTWGRDTAGDSYLHVVGQYGVMTLFRDAAASTGWANDLNASTGWNPLSYQTDSDLGLTTSVSATDYNYLSSATRYMSLLGSEAAYGENGSGVGNFNPNVSTANDILKLAVAGSTVTCTYGLNHLPDGAIITAASWRGWVDFSVTVTGAVYRMNRSTGATTDFVVGSLDTWTNTGSSASAHAAHSLTVDESLAIRTVDHSTYVYYMMLEFNGSDTNAGVANVTITYTVTSPD